MKYKNTYKLMNVFPTTIQEYCNQGINFKAVIEYLESNSLSYYYIHWFKGDIPEKYQLKLINEDPRYFHFINNPTENTIQKAIEADWQLIGSVDQPSRKVQALAMQKSHDAKNLILDPDVVVDLFSL